MIKGFFGEYRYLSNFWPCRVKMVVRVPVVVPGQEMPSLEHAYQAAKLDPDTPGYSGPIFTQFITVNAGMAKRLGRNIVIRPGWDRMKIDVMEDLLRVKFSGINSELRRQLVATGDAYLEETNTWGDVFWGVCKGKGENHLGLLLMKLREELRCVG